MLLADIYLRIMNAILVLAGVETLHITSRTPQSDRDRAIRLFAKASDEHTVLLTSSALNAFGVDFHRACHQGIMFEESSNIANKQQCCGRLWRLGQEHDVTFEILYNQGTYDGESESRNLRKHVLTLCGEGGIPRQITGTLRLLVAYEIMRIYFGQRVNRYPRMRVFWHKMDHIDIHNEGLFYSALAGLILANPDTCANLNREDVETMADNWKVGTALTLNHLTQRDPNLGADERGVALRNHVVGEEEMSNRLDEVDPELMRIEFGGQGTHKGRQRAVREVEGEDGGEDGIEYDLPELPSATQLMFGSSSQRVKPKSTMPASSQESDPFTPSKKDKKMSRAEKEKKKASGHMV